MTGALLEEVREWKNVGCYSKGREGGGGEEGALDSDNYDVYCSAGLVTGVFLPFFSCQFVFQAAMTYPEGVFGRVEEGPAVFSVFPIVSSDYILLPRYSKQ